MQKLQGTNCDECPLVNKSCFVPTPIGNEPYLFIGGAPTNLEVLSGDTWSGDNGRLLQKVLNYHNIDKHNVYLTPVVKCVGFAYLNPKQKAQALGCCSPALSEDLSSPSLEAVVTLGADAALSVRGRRDVLGLRVGAPKKVVGQDLRILSTVSPSLCLVQERNFPFLVTDIGKLVNKAEQYIEPEFDVVDSEDTALEYLYNLVSVDYPQTIVLDIEVNTDKDFSFEHPENFEMLCIGLKFGLDKIKVFTPDALTQKVYDYLKILCKDGFVIAHNGKFDLGALHKYMGTVRLDFDTMLASYLFDERSGVHGLKYIAQEYLGAPAYNDDVKSLTSTGKWKDIPKEILYKYNAFDIDCTYKAFLMYNKRLLNKEELQPTFDMLIDFSNLIQDVEHNGMNINEQTLEDVGNKLEHEANYLRFEMIKFASGTVGNIDPGKMIFNPGSPLQVKKLFAHHEIGLASTNEEMLNKVLDYSGKLPDGIMDFTKNLLEFRKTSKLKNTYVDGMKSRLHKGKVHSSFLIHGTTTGRLSSRNPNLQNIPRNSPIKSMFEPSGPGRVLLQSDYSQAELRVLAWITNEEYLIDIFNDPTRDIFNELTPEVFPGTSKEAVGEKEWKEMRTMVKTYVYGLNYGRTEHGIAKGFGIPVETAKLYMDRFLSVIPHIVAWQKMIKAKVKNGDDLITPYGRHRRYTLITKENERNVMNEALAFIPQSTASDMTLTAAVKLRHIFDKNYYSMDKPRIVNLIHDAIMVDCKEGHVPEVQELMESRMVESAKKIVRDKVLFAADSSYGKTWGDLK